MHRNKRPYIEVSPMPKRRTARDWNIGPVIEVIVGWVCVLACVALLILLSNRPVPAAEHGNEIFSKIFSNEFTQTGDNRLSVLKGDQPRTDVPKMSGS